MKVRKLTETCDYTLGHGDADFYIDDAEGVAQNVRTRLQLWRNSWFLDIDEGTPWLQQILGKRDVAEAVLRARILDTPGVQNIEEFSTIFDPDSRTLSITVTLKTAYGESTLSGQFS